MDMGANKEVSLFVWEGESNTKASGGVSNKGGGRSREEEGENCLHGV